MRAARAWANNGNMHARHARLILLVEQQFRIFLFAHGVSGAHLAPGLGMGGQLGAGPFGARLQRPEPAGLGLELGLQLF